MSDPRNIGIAISGGGHRATAFGLGVLLYLVDSGLNRRVRTITSVSGGSILNGYVALLRSSDTKSKQSFGSFGGFGTFDQHAARLALLLSGNRSIWYLTTTIASLAVLAAIVAVSVSMATRSTALASLALVLVGLSLLIGPR